MYLPLPLFMLTYIPISFAALFVRVQMETHPAYLFRCTRMTASLIL